MQGLSARKSMKLNRADLERVPTPASTASWHPTPHNRLLGLVEDNLTGLGWSVATEQHAVSPNGQKYFGILGLEGRDHGAEDYRMCVGLRNSHDMSMPAALVLGTTVFVCDNMAFSGEVSLARRHTTHIERDLPGLVMKALGRLIEGRHDQDRRIEAYKDRDMGHSEAHDVVVRSLDAGVIPTTKIPEVLKEWREPRHPEFSGRNAWSLFNGFTEVLKSASPLELPNRTQKLHGLFDGLCGIVARPEAAGMVVN